MKVVALVVTYNRLDLLKQCLEAITAQTVLPVHTIVVNNGSTDGTTEWLAKRDITTLTIKNNGGAWGFNVGIKEAYATGADWIWVMDDDTIPYANALEELVNAVQNADGEEDRFGFFGSKVIWKDGSWHLMNKPGTNYNFCGKKSFEYYQQKGLTPVIYNSFVSMLISREAVEQAGLPIKEFFIWNDDIEYTQRIIKKGFKGALVEKSIVLHKTPVNYASDIFTDCKSNLWKYRFGLRNELYTRRYHKGYWSYVRNVFKRGLIYPFKILLNRKTDRWAFIKTIWQSTWDACNFDPRKEYVGTAKPRN